MNRKLNKIRNADYVKLLFALCWIAYCTSYLGRLNYSSAMALMIAEGALSASGAGFISMLYFFAYGIGQLINGMLADRMDPVRMILGGLVMSAAANSLMGAGGGFLFMAVVWGLNGYCQSMIWAPIIRIFAEMLGESDKINCSVDIASSGVVGTLLSYLLSAALISLLPWNSVFYAASVLLLAAAAVFYGGIRRVIAHSEERVRKAEESDGGQEEAAPEAAAPGLDTSKTGAPETAAPEQAAPRTAAPGPAVSRTATPEPAVPRTTAPEPAVSRTAASGPAVSRTAAPETAVPATTAPKPATSKTASALICSSGLLFLLLPVVIHGMLKDGVTAWVPTYISESFGMSASLSVLLTTILPVINLTGAYAGRSVYRRAGKNIGFSLGVFFALSLGALFLLLTTGRASVILTLVLLAVITSSMMAVNTLAINVYPLRFEKYGRVSSISGFLNAMAYLGSALSTYVIGILVERAGWQMTMTTWLLGAALAFALCILSVKKVKEVVL